MNIVQSLAEVRRLLDRVRSPRYDVDTQLLPGINAAVRTFVKDRYDNIKRRTGYSFQTVERLRAELYTLVTDYVTVVPVNGLITRPQDYMYLADVRCRFEAGGEWISAEPTSYNEEQEAVANPFARPSVRKFYVNESKAAIRLVTGPDPVETQICYVQYPRDTFWNTAAIVPPTPLVVGNEYYVVATAEHNGVTYQPGQSFFAVSTVLTSGTVNLIQSIELPRSAHDEVHLLAKYSISGINERKDKIEIAKDNLAAS